MHITLMIKIVHNITIKYEVCLDEHQKYMRIHKFIIRYLAY